MDYELWCRVVGLRPTLIYGYGKDICIGGALVLLVALVFFIAWSGSGAMAAYSR